MSKATLDVVKAPVPTPTQEVLHQARAPVAFVDPQGRAIQLRKPSPLQELNFFAMLGGEKSTNPVYVGLTMPLLYIESIDGAVVTLRTQGELDALVMKLGEEGMEAVQLKVQEAYPPKSLLDQKTELKNA